MTNLEQFEKLSPEVQSRLLKIAANNTARTINLLSTSSFVLKENLDDHIYGINENVVLDRAKELCSFSRSKSTSFFRSIVTDLTLDVNAASELIDTMEERDMKELFKMYEEYFILPVNSIDDEYKLEIVSKLFEKYGWVELEEKTKHLL